MKETTYADSGVNLELGDDASRVLYEAAKLTWNNRKGKLGDVVELFEDFSGPVSRLISRTTRHTAPADEIERILSEEVYQF